MTTPWSGRSRPLSTPLRRGPPVAKPARGHLSAFVRLLLDPRLGVPLMNLDSGVVQLCPQNVVDVDHTLQPADDVDVAQESEQLVVW